MTRGCVTDEQLGQLSRKTGEVTRRVSEGTIPFDVAMKQLQRVIEGNQVPKKDDSPKSNMVECGAFGNRCTICGSCFDEGDICNNRHVLGQVYERRC